MRVERILVPLDLTPLGEVKLPVAEAYARAFKAEVILLHVLPAPPDDDGIVSPAEARARAYLDQAAARLRANDIPARPLIRYGAVGEAVVATAREEAVDLIVLGSNVRTGISRLLVGNVAEQIIRAAPCPVLLVRPNLELAHTAPAVRSFAEDAARVGPLAQRTIGIRTVEIARIIGSVGRASELGADFRPLHRRKEDDGRYQRIFDAMERGESLPPVELYKLGYGYYVLDGNHRVAAAKALGQVEIDAVVTEFVPLADSAAQRVFSERRAFERNTGLTRVGADQPGSYPRLERLIREFGERELGRPPEHLQEVARAWYASEFRPIAVRIRSMRLAEHFPGERTADLFVRIADYRKTESERQGRQLTWEEALEGFAAAQEVVE